MNIWHINPYDTVPGEKWRPGRAITMCKMLASSGHNVVWWTSNFSHFFKRHRSSGWSKLQVNPNLIIYMVPVSGYDTHLSFRRLKFHWDFATRVSCRVNEMEPPDAIIFGCPSPGADYLSVRLSKRYGARLIVDVRDLWPELFASVLPGPLKIFADQILYPFYWLRNYALKNASAISAVTQTYLLKSMEELDKSKILKSSVIYFGADVEELRSLIASVEDVPKPSNEIWFIYAGTIGEMYDFDTLLRAAKRIKENLKNVRFKLAGDGPLRDYVNRYIAKHKLDNMEYVGSLPISELARYYKVCKIGLLPYSKGSTVSMPAKVYDYFSAGFALISSLKGELEELILNRNMGVQYEAGNPESLVDAITLLATNTNLRETMSSNSAEIAGEFERSNQYKKFLELLA